MEVKMRPMKAEELPGNAAVRRHDAFAKAAIGQFAEGGFEAAELEIPGFDVTEQTVRNLLSQYGTRHGVRVRCLKGKTYLVREPR